MGEGCELVQGGGAGERAGSAGLAARCKLAASSDRGSGVFCWLTVIALGSPPSPWWPLGFIGHAPSRPAPRALVSPAMSSFCSAVLRAARKKSGRRRSIKMLFLESTVRLSG